MGPRYDSVETILNNTEHPEMKSVRLKVWAKKLEEQENRCSFAVPGISRRIYRKQFHWLRNKRARLHFSNQRVSWVPQLKRSVWQKKNSYIYVAYKEWNLSKILSLHLWVSNRRHAVLGNGGSSKIPYMRLTHEEIHAIITRVQESRGDSFRKGESQKCEEVYHWDSLSPVQ